MGHMCKDCPFKTENILKFKSSIYEDIKEKNRGAIHTCHKRGGVCEGFLQEAYERSDRDVLRDAFERSDFIEGSRIKKMIKEVDIKLGNDKIES